MDAALLAELDLVVRARQLRARRALWWNVAAKWRRVTGTLLCPSP
ncbi:hypothetical protein [Nonomuraea recticatena]|uniref:Uncharacterized protein n=1 Tax=Nonomuraea recticatena TaxID=46178 RepID=A0ABP6FDX7_9ACTN